MKRVIFAGIGALALSTGAFAQTPAGNFDAALAAAPANMRDAAMVIKWKADGSYDTLRPGTNRLMCYDQSGDAGEQPISSQCTSVGNLERVKQNKIYEAKIADRTAREAELTELEKVGTRVKNIRLVDDDHDIDCRIDGIGSMGLKSEFVKKA